MDQLARLPDSLVISIYMSLNLDYLLQKMWDYMGLVRIYTKRRGQPPDLSEPVVLSNERHGLTVEAVCKTISKEFLAIFNFALVWGRSAKFNPQRVGLSHVLHDEDVVQIVVKTLVQQKHSKDYRARADEANAKLLKERKRLRKIK
ncbi:TGS domain-containing protein [archaeon]|nr:MAG: TGS domain-containing protein [archaeon]